MSEDLLKTLREHQMELRHVGVTHVAIFGSFARGQANEESDVDVMLDIDPQRRMGIYEFVGIGCFLEDVLHRRVDIVERKAASRKIGAVIEREAVTAF